MTTHIKTLPSHAANPEELINDKLLEATLECVELPYLLRGLLAGDFDFYRSADAILGTCIAWRTAAPRLSEFRTQLVIARAALGGRPPGVNGIDAESFAWAAVSCAHQTLTVIGREIGKRVNEVFVLEDLRDHYDAIKAARDDLPGIQPGNVKLEIARELKYLATVSVAPLEPADTALILRGLAEHPEPAGPKLTAEENAIQIYMRDPSQSVASIAKEAGCDRSLLYKPGSKFKRLRETHQGTVPKGSKSKEGAIEAETEERDWR